MTSQEFESLDQGDTVYHVGEIINNGSVDHPARMIRQFKVAEIHRGSYKGSIPSGNAIGGWMGNEMRLYPVGACFLAIGEAVADAIRRVDIVASDLAEARRDLESMRYLVNPKPLLREESRG